MWKSFRIIGNMLKKILGLVTILVFSAIGLAETDVSQIASDYPYKESAILATVLGTPAEQQYKFKNPKGPKVRKFTTTKKIPEILRQWKDYEYGVWTQKGKKAPLMIIISGTGSVYNSGISFFLANVFYDRGYNVIVFSSPTTMPYIVSQSKNVYAGYIKDETNQMYSLIQQAISKEKNDGMKVDKIYIGGYSLGGFQSLLVHEMDEKNNRRIGIDKSLLLNSPISILTATQKLDGFLVKNGVYDARSLEKYMDTIFSRLMYDKSIQIKDIEFSNLTTSLGKVGLGEKDFEMLTGLLFRFYSANMTFAGEVFSGHNAVGRLSDKKSYKRFDSVSNEFREGLSVSFDEYAKEILYPYLKKYKNPNLDFNDFINEFDLRSNQDFINRNNKNIIFITSTNDVLYSNDDLDYIKNTFSNKVLIPFGGHTGVLWHADVAKLMVDKLEEK